MKRSFKMTALALTLIMAVTLGLSACGKSQEQSRNTATHFVGFYTCGRATVLIGDDGDKGMTASVTWSSSAAETSEWNMSGTFDPETMQFEYHDCIRTDYVYKENGDVDSETEVYVNGHGFMTFKEGDPLTLTWQDDQEDVAADMVFEYAEIPEEEAETGMANPWSDAGSLAAAAEGAGLDGFDICEGSEISLGEVKGDSYRYMDGMAEVKVEFPAVEMTIRKGSAKYADVGEGDISGDYTEYAHKWTQNIKGLEVTCYGNNEGDATKTIWQSGDTCYSIVVAGLGGETDFGLSADDLNSLINGIQ